MTKTISQRARRSIVAFSAGIATALIASNPASAQSAPSLSGRTVQMIVGFGAGGGFDLWGR
ncbi:MAG TPA: hypothetical protein VFI62_17095, partial [Burkholderiales bacterium]|nr:hypothetical protein [Burkholderiales bacterium]